MSDTIAQANFQDALAIGSGTIMVNGQEWGYVTGVSIDGKTPEDLINCIGGTLRRRKPESVNWTCDAAVLYDNLNDLNALKGGLLFQIVVDFTNPDTSNTNNLGQTLTLQDCRINDLQITISESSTFKLSGMAKSWSVDPK